jgi:regulator of protease activity HflC (stomatin/prohibitin superfamily)
MSILLAVLIVFGLAGLRICDQYVRGVVFRLGRYQATKGPGLYWIIPLIEWQRKVDLRINTAAVEEQETITKDNVPIKVNAVVWYRIIDPRSAVLKNVEIPQSMQRVMAQEAEALREKRARLIKAEAEFEAAEQLRKASEIIMQNPAGLELRRMQMLTEVGAEQNTMTIIMMPSEFVAAAKNLANFGKPAA